MTRPGSATRWQLVAASLAMASWTIAAQSDGSLARQLAPCSECGDPRCQLAAFQSGQPLPVAYSQDGENISPALEWKNAPAGTRGFAVMLEDPDAKEPKPYVHWTLYNLPPDVTHLYELIPTLPQLPGLNRAGKGEPPAAPWATSVRGRLMAIRRITITFRYLRWT